MGRPRKNPQLRAVTGNATHRPIPETPESPKADARKMLPPEWMTGAAKRIFEEIAQQMDDMGVLSEADRSVIEALAGELERYRKAHQAMDKNPGDLDALKIHSRIAENAIKEVRQLQDRLGLSPKARSGLVIQPKGEKSKFQKLLDSG